MADLTEVDEKVKSAIEFVAATTLDDVFENALITDTTEKKSVAAIANKKNSGYNTIRI